VSQQTVVVYRAAKPRGRRGWSFSNGLLQRRMRQESYRHPVVVGTQSGVSGSVGECRGVSPDAALPDAPCRRVSPSVAECRRVSAVTGADTGADTGAAAASAGAPLPALRIRSATAHT
jgi:hypothetical protein